MSWEGHGVGADSSAAMVVAVPKLGGG